MPSTSSAPASHIQRLLARVSWIDLRFSMHGPTAATTVGVPAECSDLENCLTSMKLSWIARPLMKKVHLLGETSDGGMGDS